MQHRHLESITPNDGQQDTNLLADDEFKPDKEQPLHLVHADVQGTKDGCCNGHENTEGQARKTINVGSLNTGPPRYRSQRYFMAYIIFGGMMNIFYQRICFSIAIVCMVNHTAIQSPHAIAIFTTNSSSHFNFNVSKQKIYPHSSNLPGLVTFLNQLNDSHDTNDSLAWEGDDAGRSDVTRKTAFVMVTALNGNEDNQAGLSSEDACTTSLKKEENEDGPLVWSKTTQGLLLGAIYWTYLTCSVPANALIQRYRTKTIVLGSISLMTLMTMVIHPASLVSPWLVFVIKLVQGACTAVAVLSLYTLWSKWAPPQERAALISMSFSGAIFGNATVFPLSGLLCKHGFFGGWPSVFYVFGFIGIAWLLLVFLLVEDSPSENSRITKEERYYIESSISNSTSAERKKVPWLSILRSRPVWAIVCGQCSFTWGLFLFLSTLPLYMFEILKMDIQSNGLYSMFPYVAFFIVTQVSGYLADGLISKKAISVIWMRRLCCIISSIIPAILLIAISFMDCTQPALVITLLSLAVGATGFAYCYFLVNPYDIAPGYAGSVLSLTNTMATIPGIVTPYFVTAVTKDKTREQWQMVFFITAAILVVGCISFCILSSSHVQPWAKEQRVTLIVAKEKEKSDNVDRLTRADDNDENGDCTNISV